MFRGNIETAVGDFHFSFANFSFPDKMQVSLAALKSTRFTNNLLFLFILTNFHLLELLSALLMPLTDAVKRKKIFKINFSGKKFQQKKLTLHFFLISTNHKKLIP